MAINSVLEYNEYCPDVKYEISDKSTSNSSDDDQYTHNFGIRRRYAKFEDKKAEYLKIAIQVLQFFGETRKAAMRLDYLYSTAFRVGYGGMEIQSITVHLGLFYEIILSDNTILVFL